MVEPVLRSRLKCCSDGVPTVRFAQLLDGCFARVFPLLIILCEGKTFAGHIMSDVARDSSGEGSGRRRRERRLPSWLRHERLARRMALAAATHHSSRRQRTRTEDRRCGGGPRPPLRSAVRNRRRSSMKPWILSTSPCLRSWTRSSRWPRSVPSASWSTPPSTCLRSAIKNESRRRE